MAQSPRPESARVLDALVAARFDTAQFADALLAASEMGIGSSTVLRGNELAFGYAPLPPANPGEAASLIFGPGLSRQSGNLTLAAKRASGAFGHESAGRGKAERRVRVRLGLSVAVVRPHRAVGDSGAALPCGAELRGTGKTLFLCRELPDTDALAMHAAGRIGVSVPPVVGAVEIGRFWFPSMPTTLRDAASARLALWYLDRRLPRGWGGFMEETMASALVPAAVSGSRSAADLAASLDAALKAVIDAWLRLSSWMPDFISYWRSYSPFPLPPHLAAYLKSQYGIVVN